MLDNLLTRQRVSGATLLLIILAATALTPGDALAQEPRKQGPRLLGHPAADLDADQDGAISREEYDLGADAIFTELDQNGDGSLSADELPRFRGPRRGHGPGMGRGPVASMIVARAADGDYDGTVEAEEWQTFLDSLDVEADGSISEDSLRAALPRPPGMKEDPASDHERRSGHLTRLLDQDGDSALTINDLQAVFAGLDQDGDGALRAEELPRFRGRRGPPIR